MESLLFLFSKEFYVFKDIVIATPTKQRDGQTSESRKNFGFVPVAYSPAILIQGDIMYMMKTIFNLPMVTHQIKKPEGICLAL